MIWFAVPVIHIDVSPGLTPHGTVRCAAIAFALARAVTSLIVSNTCGVCPGPGTLCTRLPASIRTLAGAPGAELSVKARNADAATPGDGRYPTSRASSITDRCSTAVRRYASLARRSW